MFEIFRRKKNVMPDLSGIGTDMHSHLLPGIDDGAPDTETSLQLIDGMIGLGYKQLITTPHIFWDIYKNTFETIREANLILQGELKSAEIAVKVIPAAEYFLDDHIEELLTGSRPLLTLKDNLILVETSFVNAPFDLKEMIFNLQISGYRPVLAHPERYLYFMQNRGLYDMLKDAGCLFQLNLLSLTRYYGKATTELANYLVSKNYIDFLGTDLHHHRHLEALQHAGSIMGTVEKLLDSGKILNATLNAPS